MAETNEIYNEATTETERSAEEIQKNILAKEQDITDSVREIGERIQEKLDWREYVGQTPFAALGIAAGLGVLASRMVPKRPTAMQRVMGTVGEEVGNRIGGILRGAGRTAFGLSLWSIASTLAVGFAKRAVSKAILGEGSRVNSPPRRDSTTEQEAARKQMAGNE
jgi:ElaB/YqjD/DUF883 family membrane-anchored ribosome-binding protein